MGRATYFDCQGDRPFDFGLMDAMFVDRLNQGIRDSDGRLANGLNQRTPEEFACRGQQSSEDHELRL